MNLRPYQQECVESVLSSFDDHDAVLAVLATGLGKTVVFSEIIGRMIASGGRALVLAHREELIYQAAAKIEKVTGFVPDIEMADLRANEQGFRRAKVVVSSVQTMNSGRDGAERMRRFDREHFRLVVADEAHHAVSKSWRSVIGHFAETGAKVLGVTATPDRSDKLAMGALFKHVAFDYGILDAVRDGWLVRPRWRLVDVQSLDLSAVKTTAGDFNGRELAETLQFEKPLHGMVYPTIEHAGDRPTLVFAASIAHAERIAEIINRYTDRRAEIVTGKTPKDARRDMLKRYASGEFQYLVNVGVATEGFDAPHIGCVAMMRPTKSRALYTQMLGRGTRPLEGVVDGVDSDADRVAAIKASAKSDLLVLDYAGNVGRHELVHAPDILSGRLPREIVERAKERAKEAGVDNDVVELLESERAIEIQRRREEAERARAGIKAEVNYTYRDVDPFQATGIERKSQPWWLTRKPASEAQKRFLKSRKVPVPSNLNMGAASTLIDAIKKREASGPPTSKQAWYLRHNGLPMPDTKAEASQIIERHKSRNEVPA